MNVDYINPFIQSASNVFETMLGCEIKRQGLALKQNNTPTYEVTAVIGLSGKVSGSVVFSLSKNVAFQVVDSMLGMQVDEVQADVVDAVGEIANMIAGGAKVGLSEYQLSLGLPNVVVGKNHSIHFPGNVTPLCIGFNTPWGPMVMEVGLDLSSEQSQQGSSSSEDECALQTSEA